MKRILKTITAIIATAVVVAGAVFAYRHIQQRSKPVEQQETAGPVKVGVMPIRAGKVAHTVWVTGEVRALYTVDVTPEVTGRLERLRLPNGTLIEGGHRTRPLRNGRAHRRGGCHGGQGGLRKGEGEFGRCTS